MKKSVWFEITLASRFLMENRKQTGLIILGICIGVSVMVFLSALIDGMQVNLVQKTVGKAPHIVISNGENAACGAEKSLHGNHVLLLDATLKSTRPIVEWRYVIQTLASDQRIKTILPVVEGPGLIERGTNSRAIILKGLDLAQADRIYGLSASIIAGNANLSDSAVLLGKDLAADLGVTAGEPIKLELAGGDSMVLVVDGIFDQGVSTMNQRWVIMDQHRVAALLDIGDRVNTIELQVYDVLKADTLAEEWSKRLPGFAVESWLVSNTALLAALRSQSSSSYTIQFFVMLAVILGVASVLAVSAVQKSKQIGILKAIGIRTTSVARVFMLQGLVLGVLGTFSGLGLGLLMSKAFIILAKQDYELLLKPVTTTIIVFSTIGASILAAYLPARQVAQIDPIEVIRNN